MINYRAWDIKNQKMFNIDEISYFDETVQLSNGEYKSFEDVFLMHSSGLKDTNNTEIYERDIVRFDDGTFGAILFEEGAFWVAFENIQEILFECNDEIEVIGTLFQDPDLALQIECY